MAASLTIQSLTVTLQGGQILAVSINGIMANAPGVSGTVSFPWVLSAAEQTASAGFVTQVLNKLAAATGMTVASA